MGPDSTDVERRDARLTRLVARILRAVGQHWLSLASLAMLMLAGLPVLAAVLAHQGADGAARVLHLAFAPLCHQLPERSYFLYGPQVVYESKALARLVDEPLSRWFIGNASVGYKMAICQRCEAIYTAWLALGIVFGLVRTRLRPIGLTAFIALLVPMGVDGIGQLAGLWASTWLSRTITGVLFSLGVVWLAYPYLESGMRQMRDDATRTLEGADTG